MRKYIDCSRILLSLHLGSNYTILQPDVSVPAESASDYLWSLGKGRRWKKWQMNGMAGERNQGEMWQYNTFISCLGLCSNSTPPLPRPVRQLRCLFSTPTWGRIWTRVTAESIFSTWKAGKLKTGFTHFLETVKQAGGPTVRERGRERYYVTKCAQRDTERGRD